MPLGRKITETHIVSPNSRNNMYDKLHSELDSGKRAFIVCPLITDSEDVKSPSAQKMYDTFSKKELKGYKVGLLHGKMKSEDKSAFCELLTGQLQV